MGSDSFWIKGEVQPALEVGTLREFIWGTIKASRDLTHQGTVSREVLLHQLHGTLQRAQCSWAGPRHNANNLGTPSLL